jgi:hypothetical protein
VLIGFHTNSAGDCELSSFPDVDFTAIQTLDLVSPSTLNIWMYVILSLSFVWLLSSFTLIISKLSLCIPTLSQSIISALLCPHFLVDVKKSNLRYANGFLYVWCLITFVIAIVDLVLFILFVIDYETILSHSLSASLNFAVATSSILLSAQNAAGIMYSVALRGYALWLINLVLSLYLFTQTFKVYDYNKLASSGGGIAATSGHVNSGFKSDDIQQHSIFKNQPIKAYDIQQLSENLIFLKLLLTHYFLGTTAHIRGTTI